MFTTSFTGVQVRIAAQAVVACNKLWLLAGWDPGHKQDGGDILSDIQAMDLATNKWEEIILNVRPRRVSESPACMHCRL